MNVYVTGDVGFSTDADEVFGYLDTKLLLATVLLVLVLLGAIYRSVLVAITPLIVVFFAYTIAPGLHLPLREVGRHGLLEQHGDPRRPDVRGGDRLLPLTRLQIPRGASPDRGQARRDGARGAARRPRDPGERPDVTLAMLVLALADTGNTKSLGPVAAIGVFSAMVAGLTLLPTLLTIFGRQGLLAARQHRRLRPGAPVDRAPGRLAALRRSGPPATRSGAGGHGQRLRRGRARRCSPTRSTTRPPTFFKKSVESVEGFKVLESGVPGRRRSRRRRSSSSARTGRTSPRPRSQRPWRCSTTSRRRRAGDQHRRDLARRADRRRSTWFWRAIR